jgi:NAD(P)-dependent dehydrogenase (short-subunit alcohol dehydrogenase family)
VIDLSGNTALITGASRGIGAATARHFGNLGANVLLAARSVSEIEKIAAEIRAAGGQAKAVGCDVSTYADVSAAVDTATSAFGGLDILVNNAGLIEPISRIADSDPDAWGHVTDVNYKGVYHGLRAALPIMLKAGHGTIINVSSGAATTALDGWSHYCSSKAAALMLTRMAHLEYGPDIRTIGLSPGTVATDMQVQIKASGINPVSQLDPNTHIPTEWVAKAIAFLTTDEAARFSGEDFSLKTEQGRRLVGL